MTIFNLYIFDEKGSLLYYREWLRKKHTSMDKEEVITVKNMIYVLKYDEIQRYTVAFLILFYLVIFVKLYIGMFWQNHSTFLILPVAFSNICSPIMLKPNNYPLSISDN